MRNMEPRASTAYKSSPSQNTHLRSNTQYGVQPGKPVKKSSSSHGCSTTEKRNSYPYRRIYFEKNPGMIFGHLWFCSQCGRPIWSKKNVAVDHIIPLNKGGVNHYMNCVAICNKCNRSKSDKVDYRVAVGFTSKAIQSVVQLGMNVVKGGLKGGFNITKAAVRETVRLGSSGLNGFLIVMVLFLIIAYIVFKLI